VSVAEIFDIRSERAKRKIPEASYFVRVDLYADGVAGEVQLPDMTVEELRSVSDNLFALARHVRDNAWSQTRDDDDRQVSVTRIYASGRVNCWTSDDIASDDDSEWLKRRFEDAAEASQPTGS
jgi:hypothetical protein